MKPIPRHAASGAIAVLCLALANGLQAQAQLPQDEEALAERASHFATASTESKPAQFNKASGIIGMEVCNHQNEHLGEIKDVVFDLKSERVAYAVLKTLVYGYEQEYGEKLVAVPLSALTGSVDQKHLILRADRSKLETAMGFHQDNWPSIDIAAWGAEPVRAQDTSGPGQVLQATPVPDTDNQYFDDSDD